MMWNYNANGTELPSFVFDDNNANLPYAGLNRLAGIIVYLINRTSLANGMFQFTSQLSIGRITDDSINATCTAMSDPINVTDADICSLSVQISGKLNKFSKHTLCFKYMEHLYSTFSNLS